MRAIDWASTPLGPVDAWPEPLRTLVELVLSARQPLFIAWGPALTSLFNDAFLPILGGEPPGASLGLPCSTSWAARWDEFGPLVAATLAGEAQDVADHRIAPAAREGLRPRWFSFSLTPIRDAAGQVAGFHCAAVETTDKVLAELALTESRMTALRATEDRYRTLFGAMDEGFCIIEMLFDASRPTDYRFLEVNAAFERHSGIRGAVGRRMREIAPEHEDWWFETYGRVALTGEPARFENYSASLGERWFDVFAFRVGAPEKRHLAVLFNDITARKRAEAALQQANRRKDEFLATLAHELRNPLAPLRTGLDLARLRRGEDAELRRILDMMDRQLLHLVRLVDDLLDVARVSTGKLQLQMKTLTLGAILASSVEATAELMRARGHELGVAPGAELVRVSGDFDRLSQVFTNLLSNAAKYTDPGGKISVTSSLEGSDVVVRVSDTGIGIPPAELGQVFDLFSQVRAHQGLTGGGLGIGLALVKSLITMHGGSVEVTSAGLGRGSTFSVRLPAAQATTAEAGATDTRAAAPRAPGGQRRILVADDNTDGAAMLAELFALLGHEVWTASDGVEALEKVAALHPDMVVLDLGMPRMDGYEAARRIRATAGGRDVLLVALTGWGQEADRRRTREAGFDRHLVKPVDHADLARLLASAGPDDAP